MLDLHNTAYILLSYIIFCNWKLISLMLIDQFELRNRRMLFNPEIIVQLDDYLYDLSVSFTFHNSKIIIIITITWFIYYAGVNESQKDFMIPV